MPTLSAKLQKTATVRLAKPMRVDRFRPVAESMMAGSRYSVLPNFIKALKEDGIAKTHRFTAKNGRVLTCISSTGAQELGIHDVATGLFPAGYFCNMTAVYHHGLTNQVPETVCICHETAVERPGRDQASLTESAIRAAFVKPHRPTRFILRIQGRELVVVDRVRGSDHGVEIVRQNRSACPQGSRIAGLERTLIDAVVAPHYNGGIASLPEYFQSTRGKVDIEKLIQIYSKLRFVYPYAQAIGFFLEHSGHQKAAERLRDVFSPAVRFFADHGAKSTWRYDERWMLYYPQGIVDED